MKINLSALEIPEIKEIRSQHGDYYLTNIKNNFFENLIYLYDNSSIHKSFIDNLKDKIIGSNVNSDRETKELIDKIIHSLCIFGGFYVEIIWNPAHTKITSKHYIDFMKVRSGMVDEETDKVLLYYYSNDWTAYRKKFDVIQAYNTDENSDARQIYFFKLYTPGFNVYPKPPYFASLRWIYADIELCRYYSNLVKNNFVANVIISMRNGFDDDDKRQEFEKSIKDNFTGSDNAGSIPIIYGSGEEDPIKIVQFNQDSDDNKYTWLSQHVIDQIIIGHRIPNPLLCGVRVPGSLGGSTELSESEEIYNKNVVYPMREHIYNFIDDINPYLLTPIPREITDISVVSKQNITPTV